MQATKLLLLLLSLGFLTFQCGKPEINPNNSINFNGITATDFNAQPLGKIDTTDWTLKDNWTTQEIALFSSQKSVCSSVAAEEKIFTAAPNPTSDGLFYFGIQAKENVNFVFRLVDKNYNVLWKKDSLTFAQGFNQLNISLKDVTAKDTLRLYYKMIKSNCEMRGHGDILVK